MPQKLSQVANDMTGICYVIWPYLAENTSPRSAMYGNIVIFTRYRSVIYARRLAI